MSIRTRTPKLVGAIAAVSAIAFALTGCAGSSDSGSSDAKLGTIKVGALATPAGDILKYIQDNEAKAAGLDVQYTEFQDYNTPNPALHDGDVQANLFQNETFLDTYNKAAGDDLVSVGKIYLPTAAFYSDKVKSVDDLTSGATIAVPNDPTNEGRALKILAGKGLIETRDNPTVLSDITSNPKKFTFKEIDNATLPQSLPDVDAAFVTLSFALPAGLDSSKAILVEGKDSDYYNVLATTKKLADDPRVLELKKLLLSDKTKAYLNTTWDGLVVPAS
ncbi:D-methionine transport system substrate-binding protein [Frondihabitans sp. PhB188]|uniref:MetQ/NlpA family ABC transporter substrate-binding protein n=1 Tax=Frondihabitans sp. PhB188 TaxID=2485200 RepID=UPI000FB305DA|nr:MetQ/NlpA family ABC transporter substrate-binding protein [Frondihabitans sp. PhB188]ROQ38268.1 D-methionine transport system substrate-binding protein [Frondihabitans sp. PhB188]